MFERILVKAAGGDRVRAHDLDRRIRAAAPRVGMALGCVGGVFALWSAFFAAPAVEAFSAQEADVRTSVSSFAARCMRIWAESSEHESNRLDQCWGKPPYLPPFPSVVISTSVSSLASPADTHQEGIWSAVIDTVMPVPANLPKGGDDQQEQPKRQAALQSPENFLRQTTDVFFQLTVSRSPDGALLAVEAPMPIAAPKKGKPRAIAANNEVRLDSPLGESVNAFLGSLLVTGKGLDWHVASNSGIRQIDPPPFRGLSIDQIHTADDLPSGANLPPEGTATRLVVTARVQDGRGSTFGITCPITAQVVAGHWLIASIDLAPQLSDEAEDDSQAGLSAPTSTQGSSLKTSSPN